MSDGTRMIVDGVDVGEVPTIGGERKWYFEAAPAHGFCVLEGFDAKPVSEGGIIMPGAGQKNYSKGVGAMEQKIDSMRVVATSKRYMMDGVEHEHPAEVGDVVLLTGAAKMAYHDLQRPNHFVVRLLDVCAVLHKRYDGVADA